MEDAAALQPHLAHAETGRVELHERRPHLQGLCSFAPVTRARLPALGYLYVALALPALILGTHHGRAASAFFTGAAFAYLWFVASLRSKLVRYDPDGFFASVVVLGASAYLALQAVTLVAGTPELAAPASACAATAIIGSSLAAGGPGRSSAGSARPASPAESRCSRSGSSREQPAGRSPATTVFASSLGFMVWVLVTATYLLRR